MNYFQLEPDVPGRLLNPRHVLDHFSEISTVHYVLECWPEDDLITSIRVYLVKEGLAFALKSSRMTGFKIMDCVVSKGEQFHIASPGYGDLPEFWWLYIDGVPREDDFGIDKNLTLVVSERALKLLEGFVIRNAEVNPILV
jgi:hypothetical protein